MSKLNLGIYVFEDVEVLDFAGPYEVFAVANEISGYEIFNLYLLAEKPGPVVARNGFSINPHYDFSNCPVPDIILAPGGRGTRPLLKRPEILEKMREFSRQAEHTLSVCTGALVLGQAGLLDGRKSTTHHDAYDLLARIAPQTEVIRDVRYVDSGDLLSSGGISAGIEMSLYFLEREYGQDLVRKTRAEMEYPYPRTDPQ